MLERSTLLSLLVLPIVSGCGALTHIADKEVEIAPGKWTTITQWSSQLAIPRGDRTLTWKEEKDETPISLREWEGKLFLITFDRSDFSHIRFRYYAEHGNGFKEIEPNDYPKCIATQNLWLSTNNGVRPDGSVVNQLQIARDLDPTSRDFQNSLTAKVWMQLETGEEFDDIRCKSAEQSFLEEYINRHTVARLTTIQRDN
jgi:hypothetical protein